MKTLNKSVRLILFSSVLLLLPCVLYAGNVEVILPSGSAFEVITGTQNSLMKVGSDGNVGIGTTTPGAKLDVKGDLFMSGGDIKTDRWLGSDTNTFIGVGVAGSGNLSHTAGIEGWANTAVGNYSLYSNTTGNLNIAIGGNSLRFNTTGETNTALGISSLYSNTTGNWNTALGGSSLVANTTGANNTALGASSLQYNTTGIFNTVIGKEAGYGVSGSSDISYNVLLGSKAGYSLLTGGDLNTIIGSSAGDNITTGANNIILGYGAGGNITTGAINIILGYNLDAPSATGSNQMYLGGVIYGDLSTGNIGIGTTTPNDRLDVAGDVDATGCFQNNDTGTIGGTCLSDERFKEKITAFSGSLDKLNQLKPVRFDWREDGPNVSGEHGSGVGLIAQEVEKVLPHLVVEGADGYKRVRYDIELQMHLIEAVKELKTENDMLKERLIKLEERIN